jgi:hypothetical protein
MRDKSIDPHFDLWFTDGSGIHDCFGKGSIGPLHNYRDSLSTEFSAEVVTILRYTQLLLTKYLMRRTHICFDSRAALATLAKPTTESSQVWECMQMLGKISEFNKVTLVWIPGLQGIPANEEAVKPAKEATIEVPPNQFIVIPFCVGRKLIMKQLELRHQTRWTAYTGCRQSKMLMRYPLPSRPNDSLLMNNLKLGAAVGLLTGHTSLRAHLHKL